MAPEHAHPEAGHANVRAAGKWGVCVCAVCSAGRVGVSECRADTVSAPLQKALPRLPLPDLGHTLEMYLESVGCPTRGVRGVRERGMTRKRRCVCARQTRAVLTEEEFKRTEEVVAEFGQAGGVGQQLHAKLAEMKAKTDSHTWDSSEFQTWLVRLW